MSKMSKAIAVLGVVAGLGVAALPLSTYAEDGIPLEAYKTSTSAQVQVQVEGAISIANNVASGNTAEAGEIGANGIINLGTIMPGSMTGEMDGEADGDLKIGTLDITVQSNSVANFDLYVNTLGDGNDMVGTRPGAAIPAGKPEVGKSAWGYAYKLANESEFSDYQAVPDNPTKLNGTTMSTAKPTGDDVPTDAKATSTSSFKFKASASTSQVADTYAATVVFTAVAR